MKEEEEESQSESKTGEEVLAEVLKNTKESSSSEDDANVFINPNENKESDGDDFVVDVQLETKNQRTEN